FKHIVLCLDNDERRPDENKSVIRGKEAKAMITPLLHHKDVYTIEMGAFKDPREMYEQDKEGLLNQLIYERKPYKPSLFEQQKDIDLKEIFQEIPRGITLESMPLLSGRIGGIRKKELIMVIGNAGSGKTTLMQNIQYQLMKKNKKTYGMYLEGSFEESMGRFSAIELEMSYREFQSKRKDIINDPNKLEKLSNFLQSPNTHWCRRQGAVKIPDLMDALKFLHVKHAVEYFFIDHISYLTQGDLEKENQILSDVCTALSDFVAEHGVTVICACQTGKMAMELNKYRSVTSDAIRGSSVVKEKATTCIAIQEFINNSYEKTKARLLVDKNRSFGTTGLCDIIKIEKSKIVNLEEND
ncbi:MAG: hypothetical protein CME61_00675, partial [Halobacteriovoraceae bacterium]|nr:hypothetical protein [Halobacteriovoraceae bacterium]